MALPKGSGLEELVLAYFLRQGFFALRGVSVRFEDEQVTDLDVWLYGKQSAGVRTRTIVDVKEKRSPKAFERVLWARGMQLALSCDRAVVATTDNNPKVVSFAHQQKVGLLTKSFLDRLSRKVDSTDRLTSEQLSAKVSEYKQQKQDGDWLQQLADAKSALISQHGYPAFNRAISAFRFFAERAATRSHYYEQALRCVYIVAAVACIALDSALEKVVYDDGASRFRAIALGVTYGDAGDAKVQGSIDTVLSVMAASMQNGKVVALQAKDAIDDLFRSVRADIIAEHFSKEQHASSLFAVARELDAKAFSVTTTELGQLSLEARSALGVFLDFVRIKRGAVLSVVPPVQHTLPILSSSSNQPREGAAETDPVDNNQVDTSSHEKLAQ